MFFLTFHNPFVCKIPITTVPTSTQPPSLSGMVKRVSAVYLSNHGLYGSTSCLSQGDFRPPTAPRTLNRFPRNSKHITTSRTQPRMQNFRKLSRRGWSEQIASLMHESFCPFLLLHRGHRSHLIPLTLNT